MPFDMMVRERLPFVVDNIRLPLTIREVNRVVRAASEAGVLAADNVGQPEDSGPFYTPRQIFEEYLGVECRPNRQCDCSTRQSTSIPSHHRIAEYLEQLEYLHEQLLKNRRSLLKCAIEAQKKTEKLNANIEEFSDMFKMAVVSEIYETTLERA